MPYRREQAINDLETELARRVREYIRASAEADNDSALAAVCSGLEYLLGKLLNECEGWNGWVDGITPADDMIPNAISVDSNGGFSLRGRALWANGGNGPFWIEPFFAFVQVSETSDKILSYQLLVGDAERGLAKLAYEKRVRRPEWFFPAKWLYRFAKIPNSS